MDNRTIAAIDFGSYKTALCIISMPQEGMPCVRYYAECPSLNCVSKSYMVNEGKAREMVKKLVFDAQKALDCKITKLVTGLPKYPVTASRKLQKANCNREIGVTDEDIEDLHNEVVNHSALENENDKIYHAQAICYSDSESYGISEDDIKGRCVSEIEGEFLVLSGSLRHEERMNAVISSAGETVCDEVISSIAAADFVLKKDEKYSGVAFIDMGGAVTSLVIYHKGVPVFYASIPFGSDNITRDISNEFNMDLELADKIKKEYGFAFFQNIRNLEEKNYRVSNDSSVKAFSDKDLCRVIEARQKEIFDAVLYEIEKSGYADKLRNGIVLCGGGALLNGCVNLMEDMSGLDVRLGFPDKNVTYSDEYRNVSAYSDALSVIGIAMNSKDNLDCVEFNDATDVQDGFLFGSRDLSGTDAGTGMEPDTNIQQGSAPNTGAVQSGGSSDRTAGKKSAKGFVQKFKNGITNILDGDLFSNQDYDNENGNERV